MALLSLGADGVFPSTASARLFRDAEGKRDSHQQNVSSAARLCSSEWQTWPSSLHAAVARGDPVLVELLLQRGAPATTLAAQQSVFPAEGPAARAALQASVDTRGRSAEDLAAELLLEAALEAQLLSPLEAKAFRSPENDEAEGSTRRRPRDEETLLRRHVFLLGKVETALAKARGGAGEEPGAFLQTAAAIPTELPLVWPSLSPKHVRSRTCSREEKPI